MRVLFDNNVPAPMARHLVGHQVRTARSMRWHELENGDLLRAAEQDGFEVMVNADKNLSYQQNLADRVLALVVLSTNDWSIIRQAPELVSRAVDAAYRGSFQEVSFDQLGPRPLASSQL